MMNKVYCLCLAGKTKNWNTFYEKTCELFSSLNVMLTHFACDSDKYTTQKVVPATKIRIKHLNRAINENAKFESIGIYSAPDFLEEDGYWIYYEADLYVSLVHSPYIEYISVNMNENLYKKLKRKNLLNFVDLFIDSKHGELYCVDVDIASETFTQKSMPQNYNSNHVLKDCHNGPYPGVKVLQKL